MKISLQKYAHALCESLREEKDPQTVAKKIQNLLKLLTKRKQGKLIKQLLEVFKTYWHKKYNKIEITVVLAKEPSTQELEDLGKLLKDAFKKEMIISTRINPQIIGGMKLEFDDCLIDGTVAASLLKLRENLTASRPA